MRLVNGKVPERFLKKKLYNQPTVADYPFLAVGRDARITPDLERSLLVRAKEQGDKEAFDTLYECSYTRLYYLAMKVLHNADDALDAVQNGAFRAYRAISTFNVNSPFYPWVSKIVYNVALNTLATRNRASNTVSLDELRVQDDDRGLQDQPSAEDPSPLEVAIREEERKHLWQAIQRLPDDYREVVIMRHFHELTYQEIADALRVPIGTVMSRLFNARKQLKSLYLEIVFDDETKHTC